MPRLRIVRGADDIALEIFAQNLRVTPLHAARHGLSDEREGLMTVEAAQLDDLSVQFEPVVGELRFAETRCGARRRRSSCGSCQQTNVAPDTDSDAADPIA